MRRCLGIIALVAALTPMPQAQAQDIDWAARLENEFRALPNITYLKAGNAEAKLDLYIRRIGTTPQPTLIFIHGGGWTRDAKEARIFAFQPYLAMGLNVVNVEYRLADVALAPAAVEDCRCALKWVLSRAKQYGIDPQKLVVAGDSAGGHLALMTGFLPASAGFERQCARNDYLGQEAVPPEMKVAAVVNWYGITDVHALLAPPNMYGGAVTWLGGLVNREEIAKRVSPLTYVRAGLPPVITIHGEKDGTVPYPQAVQLHTALTTAGVPNELITIPGGAHGVGCCSLAQRMKAYQTIQAFLRKHGVLPSTPSPSP